MRQDKIAFLHFRHLKNDRLEPKGGLTVAYTFNETESVITYDYADCSTKDHYNRKIGAAIAAGRLSKAITHEFGLAFQFPVSSASTWFQEFETYILTNVEPDDGCKLVNVSRAKEPLFH